MPCGTICRTSFGSVYSGLWYRYHQAAMRWYHDSAPRSTNRPLQRYHRNDILIYMNKDNRNFLKEQEIKTYCKSQGRPHKQQDPQILAKKKNCWRENVIRNFVQENEVECSGTGKRIYCANNIRAKRPDAARCWTGMCYFVKK